MIHSVLLIGQSNAGGRGFPSEVEPIPNDDGSIVVLRNGRWRKMYTPVNPDRVTSGVSLAESFAAAYRDDHPDVDKIGIIPCADGGSRLAQWEPGLLLYDHAVAMARLAQRTSNIVAVLWHQGEGDCYPERYPLYERNFRTILHALRRDLGLEDVPVLVGGLGQFLAEFQPANGGENVFRNYIHINDALKRVEKEEPLVSYVPATGLTSNADRMHFNASSLREFGLRYYRAFRGLEDRFRVWPEKPTMADLEGSPNRLLEDL